MQEATRQNLHYASFLMRCFKCSIFIQAIKGFSAALIA